ncbi:mechanosensitive ion channel family protein [Arenimonas sp. GDDSR-1]|uniref:mechanosensitive ion channel family protein n=1 Tax=Arenimonas sp. GDDSR-1 TaxID=2950125 RepID=UPI0026104C29|nr:mechanosensitive ion channel family protein [Arenimonas sp. GDDSR-1]
MIAGRPFALAAALLIAVLLPSAASAIAPVLASAEPAAAQAPNSASAVVFNREVAVFRGNLLGAPPALRAERAEARITEELARNPDAVVSVESNPLGAIFKIDGVMVFVLTPDDTDKLAGESLAAAVNATQRRLQQVMRESRESRNTDSLLRGAGITAIATLVLAGLLWLAARMRRFADRKLVAMTESKRLAVNGVELVPRIRVLSWLLKLTRLLFIIVAAVLVYEWLSISLAQFPYTRPWGEGLNGFLLGTAASFGSAIVHAIPDLLTAIVIFLLAYWATQLSKSFFNQIASGHSRLGFIDAELAGPTRKIIAVVIWLFALVMAYPYLPGSDSEAFKGVSVLVGLMLSLGASNVVSQGASGLILTYSRTFRIGEYVRIGDHEGTVTDLGIFNTRLRTGMGEEITLANSTVFGSVTRNYSRTVKGNGYILDTTVTIGYDTPWRQVEAMLLEAAGKTHGLSTEPAPRVYQTALSDYYPEYRLVCQATADQPKTRAQTLSDLHANIQDTFNRYGVQIMSPHYVLDPASEKVVPEDRKYAAPAKAKD